VRVAGATAPASRRPAALLRSVLACGARRDTPEGFAAPGSDPLSGGFLKQTENPSPLESESARGISRLPPCDWDMTFPTNPGAPEDEEWAM